MEVRTERFARGVRRALADSRLQAVLDQTTARFRALRAAAFAELDHSEALRDQAREIKDATLAELDHYLERLTATVTAAGGTVHRAADAAAARQLVVDLARRYEVRLAVKSKSMTTEEIGLNQALEGAGIEVVETDLGEFIIQLAGETPSHLIAPAIHKSRQDVTDLFVAKLGSPRLERHEELTREARRHLRTRFRRADCGITGLNFAVAETGTLVVVENEGNARLTTSVPRLHVAIMGMEKVIPDLAALAVFLKLLARSATGQKMSSYVSLLTGPRRAGEVDGPEALHLIVLDNGRSRLLADPRLREALRCIRCSACLNVCPVYRHAGGHAYGWVYCGPIGAVITPSFVGRRRAAALPFASSLCAACREVCPVRIDLPALLLEQRRQVVLGADLGGPGRRLRRPGERCAVRFFVWLMAAERRYRLACRLLSRLGRPFRGRRMGQLLPGLSGWTRWRDLPVPVRPSFRDQWRERED